MAVTSLAGCVGEVTTGDVMVCIRDAPHEEFSSIFVAVDRVEVHLAMEENMQIAEDPLETIPPVTCVQPTDVEGAAGPPATPPPEDTGHGNASNAGGREAPVPPIDGHDADEAWIVITESRMPIDLLAMETDLAAVVGSRPVPAGNYSEIRVTVGRAWGVLSSNDSRVDLDVRDPTVRLGVGFVVLESKGTKIILDAMLNESLVQPNGTGPWVFRPVLNVHVQAADTQGDDPAMTPRPGEGETDDRDGTANDPAEAP